LPIGASTYVLTSSGTTASWQPATGGGSGSSISNGTSNVTVNSSGGTVTIATAGTTALTVDTTQTFLIGSGVVSASSSGGLNVNVTQAGSSSVPLVLQNQSTSNGSGVYLAYRGKNSGGSQADYNYIQFVADSTSAGTSSMRFYTANGSGPVENLRINSNGVLALKGGSTSATGVGVAFPATQDASSDANTLDDYEEGNGTPTVGLVTSGSVTLGGGASYQYTKIGNLVTFTFEFQITATSSPVGAIKVNVPFTSSVYSAGALRVYNVIFTGVPFLEIASSSSFVSFKTNVTASANGDITGQTGYFYGTITYRV
jgi:hypothetical protein